MTLHFQGAWLDLAWLGSALPLLVALRLELDVEASMIGFRPVTCLLSFGARLAWSFVGGSVD